MNKKIDAKSGFKLKGLMLDPARVVEKKSYYRELLPKLANWGYNFLHLHLIDDQQCALVFPSHPELASDGAFSAEEMRDFIKLAASFGIQVMPEIETLGHAELIFRQKKFSHLREPSPSNYENFNALCPAHSGTRELLTDLILDLTTIFDHPVIHVGLDEASLGACPRCLRKFGNKVSAVERYAIHTEWVTETVRSLGKRPAMWADHLVKEPGILKRLKKDVLLFNWDYDAEFAQKNNLELLNEGFEVVACPALVRFGTVFAPNRDNITNVRSCISRSIQQTNLGLIGIVNTVWCPWRYLPGAIDFGMALGGHLMNFPMEDSHFTEKFVKDFYGIKSPDEVGRLITSLYDSGFAIRLLLRIVRGDDGIGNQFGREDIRTCSLISTQMSNIHKGLADNLKHVRQNKERYKDLLLAAEGFRALAMFGVRGRKKGVPGAKGLLRRTEKAWKRDRRKGDPLRFASDKHTETQSMLYLLKLIS